MGHINPSTIKLNILTFNWHEPYLCLLAKLGYNFLVVEPEIVPGHIRRWDENMRSVPGNVQLISLAQAKEKLDEGSIDLAIAQNINDLIWIREYDLPKIIVFHNRLTTEIGLAKSNTVTAEEYRDQIQFLLQDVHKVFISESKRKDWGMDGTVILPGIDTNEYGGYTGEQSCILRIGNLMRERDLMMGYTASTQITEGFPCITLGLNPGLPGVHLSRGFDDLLNHYRQCRCYINTTVDDYEDGYNLAMLEAMATGMPVISTSNRTSPIHNGVNGFISNDLSFLRRCAEELLKNPVMARELGEKARQTIIDKFNIRTYLNKWNAVISETIMSYLKKGGIEVDGNTAVPFFEKQRKNILMEYVSYPATTAFYLERALRKHHNVITCGSMITPEIIRHWNLETLKWEIKPHDIDCSRNTPLSEIMKHLPQAWAPDLYLWVENGISGFPQDIDKISIPKACYLIDTHLHLEQHKEIARNFDFVFLAQQEYVSALKASGNPNVYWMPLACDPEIHGRTETDIEYDIGFVGSITPAHTRRKKLLDDIGRHFNLHLDRKFMDEMAMIFSKSKIVFNEAIKNDLNMRVFEALCSGSLLVTDDACGLTDFFQSGKHLVTYRDESLVETIRYYLEHPEERIRIAKEGQREALAKHTYEHRIKFMMDTLDEHFRNATDSSASVPDKPGSYYHNVRYDILPLVPEDATCILEVGCASGATGKALKESRGEIFVAGIELNPDAAREARKNLDDVVEGNIETLNLPYQENSFDCIIMADVLEHLIDPLGILKKLKSCLKPGGTIIASLPNVQFFGLIHHLVEGNWTYQKEGILDETHLRFFTLKEMKNLFESAGFEIAQIDETLDPQYEAIEKSGQNTLKVGRITISDLSKEELRRFFVFQYKFVAKLSASNSLEVMHEQARLKLLGEAKVLERDKSYVEAMEKYHEANRWFPDCVEIMVGLANCYVRAQDLAMAELLYREALAIDPRSMDAWFGIGLLYTQTSDYDSAVKAFSTVLGQDTQHDKALCGLGMVCYQKNMKSEAMHYFIRSLNINLENKTSLMFLLRLAYELNQFAVSEEILKKYLELHPASLDIMFGVAGIQYKMNKLAEARDNLEKILIFEPNHKDAQQLLERVLEETQVAV